MMAIGFAISYLFYISRPYLPVELAEQQPLLYRFLLNKWYFDELYDLIFVRPAKWLGYTLWKQFVLYSAAMDEEQRKLLGRRGDDQR